LIFSKHILNNYLPKLLFLSLLASTAFAYSGGTGEPNTPYQIGTVSDWQQLMTTSVDWNKHFIMTADINLMGVTVTPVGDSGIPFTGVFDGNGHTISYLKINTNDSVIGLFGYIGSNGVVQNIRLEGIDIKAICYVGGIAGTNKGLIQNCHVSGIIAGDQSCGGITGFCGAGGSPPLIRNCSFRGQISGTWEIGGIVGSIIDVAEISKCYAIVEITGEGACGGIIGDNSGGNFKSCFAKGSVIASQFYAGGFAGNTSDNCGIGGQIQDCYADVIVNCSKSAGGFAGVGNGEIWNCYCSGKVVYDVNNHSHIGGFIGFGSSNVFNSFWDMDTSGQTTSAGGTGKTTAQMKTRSTFTDAGWDFIAIWNIVQGQTYPFFKKENYSGGTGTSDAPYEIANACDLLNLAGTPADYNKAFILVNDINLAGLTFTIAVIAPYTEQWNGVFDGTSFTGVFDGSGHSIFNLTINSNPSKDQDYTGLFGQIGPGGIVKNLGIEDVNIIVSGGCHNSYDVGGLCGGSYYGNISNCFSTGKVTGYQQTGGLCGESYYSNISNCFSTAKVTGDDGVGGLCGSSSDSNISNCYSTGQVSGDRCIGGLCGGSEQSNISDCFSKGNVSGYDSTGGLCGYSGDSNFSNCYSTGQVTGNHFQTGGLCGYSEQSNISDCFSTGNVSGYYETGGLCGENCDIGSIKVSITNCYSTGNVSGNYYTGGLCGLNFGIFSISNCYTTGSVTGSYWTGGLCGDTSGGSITNCYSTGNVSGGEYNTGGLCGSGDNISDCYSTGAVSGSSGSYSVGGLVGSGSATNSFWDVNSSGLTDGVGDMNPDPEGVIGKTTAEMKTLSTFTSAGWDFSYSDGDEAVWYMPINEYPILPWQISPADIYTDGKNNFRDFAALARFWMRNDCRRYNSYCDWADLNFDGSVDIDDLIEFMNYWLQSGIYE
jgi:hypothetical protein